VVIIPEAEARSFEPGGFLMIVPFFEATSGVAVYINPAFVISLRPDPADTDRTSLVKLSDGESLRIRGDHHDVAARLSRATAAV
jgi:hypothetical protein